MIYVVIGRRERGKTTLAYSMARRVRKRVVLDPRRMIVRSDVEIVSLASDLRSAFSDLVIDDAVNEIVYQPADDDLEEAFTQFCGALKTRIIKSPEVPLAVLIDESSFFNLDDRRFQWLAKCTKRDMVHLLVTAHRPADVPTSIRAITDHFCVFATTQEHDLKSIEQRCGTVRVVNAIRGLKDREYVHWDDARGQLARCTNAADWYVSLKTADAPAGAQILSDTDEEWELES